MEHPNPTPEPRGSIVSGIALLVFGLVIFVPSGLCTGFFFFMPILQAMQPRGFYNFTLSGIALVVGGPFVFGGGAALWHGFRILRAHLRKSDAPDQF